MISKRDNLKLLDKRISQLKLKGKTVIAFDFDELIIPDHLTRIIAQRVSKPVDQKKLNKLGSCSFEGLKYLHSLIVGYDLEKYRRWRDRKVSRTKWGKGFRKLFEKIMPEYSIIIISSGLKDVCKSKLKKINFYVENLLGNEFKRVEGKITGTDLIISDELKGYIVRKLRRKYKIISVGHSLGDKYMLSESDVSIAYKPDIPDLAMYNVDSAEEIYKIIKKEAI